MEGAARVGSAVTRQSWRAGVWEPRNVPASRTGVKCGPLSPVYSARPAPRPPPRLPRDTCPWTPPLPQASWRRPGRLLQRPPPRVFSWCDLRREGRRGFREGYRGVGGGGSPRWSATAGDRKRSGCQSAGLCSAGGHWEAPWQSWKLFSHVVAQRVAE